MSTLQIIMAIGIPVVSALLIALCFCIGRKTSKFFTKLSAVFIEIKVLSEDSKLRKEESIINLDGMFIIMDALKGEQINGNVDDLRERYRRHTNRKSVG